MKAPRSRRAGREATMEAILTAAEQLFALQGLDGTSVREVAARAGVTHALVHRYFGTKDDLYRAVLARHEDVIRDAAEDVDDLVGSAARMVREGLAYHRDYLRLLVASAVSGVPYDRSIVNFSATQRLVDLARSAAARSGHPPEGENAAAAESDRRLGVAMASSLLLGWASTEPWLAKAVGIEGLGDEATAAGVERAVRILLEGWFPAPDDADAGVTG